MRMLRAARAGCSWVLWGGGRGSSWGAGAQVGCRSVTCSLAPSQATAPPAAAAAATVALPRASPPHVQPAPGAPVISENTLTAEPAGALHKAAVCGGGVAAGGTLGAPCMARSSGGGGGRRRCCRGSFGGCLGRLAAAATAILHSKEMSIRTDTRCPTGPCRRPAKDSTRSAAAAPHAERTRPAAPSVALPPAGGAVSASSLRPAHGTPGCVACRCEAAVVSERGSKAQRAGHRRACRGAQKAPSPAPALLPPLNALASRQREQEDAEGLARRHCYK